MSQSSEKIGYPKNRQIEIPRENCTLRVAEQNDVSKNKSIYDFYEEKS